MDSRNVLPALPASDGESLERNTFNEFYRIRSNDFWRGNEINHIEEKPYVKCEHYFISAEGGVKCQKCHFGLIGSIEVLSGKLFYKGQEIEL